MRVFYLRLSRMVKDAVVERLRFITHTKTHYKTVSGTERTLGSLRTAILIHFNVFLDEIN